MLGIAEAVRQAKAPIQVWPVGGSFAVLGEPGSPFNKVIALGFDGEPAVDELETIERRPQRARVYQLIG